MWAAINFFVDVVPLVFYERLQRGAAALFKWKLNALKQKTTSQINLPFLERKLFHEAMLYKEIIFENLS